MVFRIASTDHYSQHFEIPDIAASRISQVGERINIYRVHQTLDLNLKNK